MNATRNYLSLSKSSVDACARERQFECNEQINDKTSILKCNYDRADNRSLDHIDHTCTYQCDTIYKAFNFSGPRLAIRQLQN